MSRLNQYAEKNIRASYIYLTKSLIIYTHLLNLMLRVQGGDRSGSHPSLLGWLLVVAAANSLCPLSFPKYAHCDLKSGGF